jgi:uncharacterized protein YndB with AHSA1/START domain
MIMGQLDAWLDGEPFKPSETWVQLRDRYVRELGPEAVRDGRRLTVDGKPVVRFKRLLHAAVPEVWAWLTEPGKLIDWLGDVDVELKPSGAYRIRFAMADMTMEGTITEVDPPRRLAMIWREPWFKNDDVILEYDLAPLGDGTLFTLTHTFPADYDPREYLGGWHEFMDAIEDAMGGKPFVWNTPERKAAYARLNAVYKAVAGAEAGSK